MFYSDLHMHSNYSDGNLTIKEILHHSTNLKLKAISITDHDTIDGVKEAVANCDNYKVEIIPGIEFSTVYKGEEIHILGYLFELTDEPFSEFIQNMQTQRIHRAQKMIEVFNINGIDISEDDLLTVSKGNSIGRPHFAQMLIRKGYADSINDAFKKYMLPGSPYYVERFKLSPQEAIKSIHNAGGISVIAHPGLIKTQNLIEDIISMKIDGIEVYHYKHTSQNNVEYYHMAKNNNLLITGGSDCHSSDPTRKPFIGTVKIPYTYVENMKEAKVLKCQ
ncbi:PHP domain-containing protein [Alkalibaculum sp. M08DMB]|uniref:PHP domain-containing protein n=1 Tax=Alkalibaculum sporogenes TaxID=2655001 RepID=A0A6A7K8H1_9FIRM|nr:PHP domain-containing protein [Alkalibaculum sporogenes]MPW25809.1 PHP domain-containing protein [Alkalibaculum sporogenes]